MGNKRIKTIQEELLIWYQLNARVLPWRGEKDPYLIWISEVMLQQTQVDTVIPYYKKWIEKFPDIKTTAEASEDEILKAWEGLGYYGRARNLKKTAEIIQDRFAGVFPGSIKQMKKLPGIGDYIAGAVSSIAFDSDEPALEANGIRVVSRLINFQGAVNKAKNKVILRDHMGNLVPPGKAGDFNQAIMDLGSTLCIPNKPLCGECPLHSECLAYMNQTQSIVPLKQKRSKKPHFNVVAAIIRKGDKVLITKRPSNGLLGGMWEFPGGKIEKNETHTEALIRELIEELGILVQVKEKFGVYKHAYTHFSVTVFPYFAIVIKGEPEALEAEMILWEEVENLSGYPMGKVDRLISNSLMELSR